MTETDKPETDDTKTCPMCAETIKAAAIKCKHCGSDLGAPSANGAPPPATSAAAQARAASPPTGDLLGALLLLVPMAAAATVIAWTMTHTSELSFDLSTGKLLGDPRTIAWWVGGGAVLVSAVLVAVDADAVNAGSLNDRGKGGERRSGPLTWGIATALLWALVLPAWTWQRAVYGRRKLVVGGVLVAVALLGAVVFANVRVNDKLASLGGSGNVSGPVTMSKVKCVPVTDRANGSLNMLDCSIENLQNKPANVCWTVTIACARNVSAKARACQQTRANGRSTHMMDESDFANLGSCEPPTTTTLEVTSSN